MDPRRELDAAGDLDAVLVGPWVWPVWVVRWRFLLAVLLAVDLVLLPLVFGVDSIVFTALVVGTLAGFAVLIFVLVMQAKSGSRLVGYSARGIFVPVPVPWAEVARVVIGVSTGAGRAVTVQSTDGIVHAVAIPSTVTEPEYQAFAAALRAAATARGVTV